MEEMVMKTVMETRLETGKVKATAMASALLAVARELVLAFALR